MLEGLDKTGKSTQRRALSGLPWEGQPPRSVHLPSGIAASSGAIYRITEETPLTSPLALQLLHLACHAENIRALASARVSGGLILDRWWWSTIAYGWFGALRGSVELGDLMTTIQMCWEGFRTDLVFVFLSAHKADRHNSAAVLEGYRWLLDEHRDLAVEVPSASEESTTAFLLAEMKYRGLLT